MDVPFEVDFGSLRATPLGPYDQLVESSLSSATLTPPQPQANTGSQILYVRIGLTTRNIVFRFETERVEDPETIWNLNSYSHNAEQILLSSILIKFNFSFNFLFNSCFTLHYYYNNLFTSLLY